MRYYDVYKYDLCPAEQNPEGLPSYWVWKVVKVNPTTEPAVGTVRMSINQLRDYKASMRTDFNGWVAQKADASAAVRKKVSKAVKNAQDLIIKYAAENVMGGITQQGKTKLIADALKDVLYYAQSGSLYEALTALDALVITENMAPFLTEQKKNELKASILSLIQSL